MSLCQNLVGIYLCMEEFRLRYLKSLLDTNHINFTVIISEAIIAFAWEPGGSKFCILHGETGRISASFYDMEIQGSVELQSMYIGAYTHL